MATLVKDVMNPIEEYDTVDVDAHLCDALAIRIQKLRGEDIHV